jgi:hypothetical protein
MSVITTVSLTIFENLQGTKSHPSSITLCGIAPQDVPQEKSGLLLLSAYCSRHYASIVTIPLYIDGRRALRIGGDGGDGGGDGSGGVGFCGSGGGTFGVAGVDMVVMVMMV